MFTPSDLLAKVQAFNIDAIITQALEDTKENLADINRERMMDGIKADGSEMPHYSYISQTVYGYPDIRITLRATGSFQDNIKIEIGQDVITTGSTDEKTEKLEGRFGPEIFGTVGEYRQEYLNKFLGPRITELIQKALPLKFSNG